MAARQQQELSLSGASGFSRRKALVGGVSSALGAPLAPAFARAHPDHSTIERYAPPRQIGGVDHQDVYRREDEFTG